MANHSREGAEKATVALGVGAGAAIGKVVNNVVSNSRIEKEQKELENEYFGLGKIFNSSKISELENQKKSWWNIF